MTIEDAEAYVASLWDWGILDGCFGTTKIKAEDIDGFVERKGRFLAIETKNNNVPLKDGQRWAYKALHKTGLFTILIIWGEANKPERIELWREGKRPCICENANLDILKRTVKQWFEDADR